MKLIRLAVVFSVLAACSGTTLADSASLNEFTPKVMPVLVQVNSRGKVTAASPAVKLSPKLTRLLRESLDEMISKPATDKHGHPISSQFVINLALRATPRPKDNYEVQFAYVSTSPVPSGSWYWVHLDGHRLALASQRSSDFRRRMPFEHESDQQEMRARYQPASMSSMRADSSVPSNSPAQGPAPRH